MPDGKWIEGLSPDMTVAEAGTVVLSTRCEVVRQFLPLAVEKPYQDVEYVHQLRVATRRAAAALRVFADCMPRRHHKAAKRSLREVRRAAGDARDWDVFLVGLATVKPLTLASGKPTLDYLSGYAMAERSEAQTRLMAAATRSGPVFEKQCEELVAVLHEPRGDNPPATFGDLAAAHLGGLLASLTTSAEANPTQPAGLHQFRILAKRVRYALEIFVDCFPPNFKEEVYPTVEGVQELLGNVQDAVVGLDRLASLRDRLNLLVPDLWPRLKKGFEGLIQTQRASITSGKRAFQKWRKEWARFVPELKLEVVAPTIIL